ncbi:MAG: hypothetical protein PHN63_01935 [Candidatus Omnitrophica bacterium]|nr:hypothetical protein [Candidatus Omnitrophota bacterium]
MKVLLTLRRRRPHRYLINLFTKSLIAEVRNLIGDQQYSKAMELVYREGLLEREILEDDLDTFKADLILSERCANWDVMQ